MNLGIATDLSNINFMNAIPNPDATLAVEFYFHEPIDKWATEERGTIVRKPKTIFVRKAVPGNNLNVIEEPAMARDAERWPIEFLQFQMKHGLVESDKSLPGWHIEDWDFLNEDQIRHLRYLRFQTVEQIASASDHQVGAIGMGGPQMRAKAREALAMRMDEGIKTEIAKRDEEIATLRQLVANLASRVDAQEAARKK